MIGASLGALLEGRAPWTDGLGAAAAVLAIDLAVVRAARELSPAPVPASGAQLALALLAVELALYAVHRAMHAAPWLWRFHRWHHAPSPLRWHRGWRIHPVDAALFALAVTAAAAAVGASPFTTAAAIIVRRAWTLVLHAEARWPATVLDRWLITPAAHHRHHDETAPSANFASTLAWLDRLFGTWAAPDAAPRAPERLASAPLRE